MSIESLNEDLAQLERDVRALTQDAAQSKIEPAASESTHEHANGWLAALSEIGAIQREQFNALLVDHRESLRALTRARSPIDLIALGYGHWSRRTSHIIDGITRTLDVVTRQGRSNS